MSEQPPGDAAKRSGSIHVKCDCGYYEAWVQVKPGTCPAKTQFPTVVHRVRTVRAGSSGDH